MKPFASQGTPKSDYGLVNITCYRKTFLLYFTDLLHPHPPGYFSSFRGTAEVNMMKDGKDVHDQNVFVASYAVYSLIG